VDTDLVTHGDVTGSGKIDVFVSDTIIHHSWYWGDLTMDAYGFEPDRS
jgi:hypothetical protein